MTKPAGKIYDDAFYDHLEAGSKRSAEIIVPIVLEFLRPVSVVDVGCGRGTWLSVFREQGVPRVVGIDGPHVNRKQLLIPHECFLEHDLNLPLALGEQFGLVTCLEVGEHLPDKSAGVFVDSLTRLGDIILFSAAIPFQGGVRHLNEQWPDYWANIFAGHAFFPVDTIRFRVWNNPSVEWFYAQNMILYVSEQALAKHPVLKEEQERTANRPLRLIHPTKYLLDADPDQVSIRRTVRNLGLAFRRKLREMIATEKK